jgi:stage V sporulation protein B
MSKNQSFLKGAFILALAGFVVKLLGAVYRIPLALLIKDEGIGLYQMAYPIYVTLLAVSTAGLPTAISKMVSEKRALGQPREGYRIFRVSLIILFTIGLAFSLLLIAVSRYIADNILANPKAYYPLVSIAPAIFVVSVMSAYRGFFQGMQNMTPSALSQIAEQVGRVVSVFILVVLLLPKGIEFAAAGAAFSAVFGGISGFLIILIIYFKQRRGILKEIQADTWHSSESFSSIAYRLFMFAVPITLGGLIIPVMNLADAAIVNRRLQAAGFTMERATQLYGQLTGMAGPLINLPPIVTIALSASLVPAISEAMALNNRRVVSSRATTGIRITLMFGFPAAVGLYLLATPISTMLYKNPEAGVPLSVLAFGVVFLTLNQTTSGILQGIGKTVLPVKNLLLGALVKVFLNYTLTGIPEINIRGAAIGSVAGYMVSSLLNLWAVHRYIGIRSDIGSVLIKPLAASLVMGFGVVFTYTKMVALDMGGSVSTLWAVTIGALLYAAVLLIAGGITERDLEILPVIGPKLAGLLKRIGIIRG